MKNRFNISRDCEDLSKYIFESFEKSPKKFRFTVVIKVENLALQLMDDVSSANGYSLENANTKGIVRRKELQISALENLKKINNFSEFAWKIKCITYKQYEQISKRSHDCKDKILNWIESDKRRLA